MTEPLHATSLDASLTVKDLEGSTRWYTDVLGFALDRRHERDGKLIAVSLQAGAVRLLLTQDDGAKGMDRVKGEGFSLQISTNQSVDAVGAVIKSHGGTLDTEPTTMPWGVRVIRFRDPDGFRFTLSSSLVA
jgi:catechol 2,3-dioxygenase-like lactoylglutathione lyase family enzyme